MIEPTPLSDLVADELLLDRLAARADCGYDPLASVLGALATHADTPLGRGPVRRGGRHRLFMTFAVLAVGASGAGVAAAVTLPDRPETRAYVAPAAPARPAPAPGLTAVPAARPLALPAGGQGSWQLSPGDGSVAYTTSVSMTLGVALTTSLAGSDSAAPVDPLAGPSVSPGVSDGQGERGRVSGEPEAPSAEDGATTDGTAGRPRGEPASGGGQTGADHQQGDDAVTDITSGDDPAAARLQPGPGTPTKPAAPTTKPPKTEDETDDDTEDETQPTSAALLSSAHGPRHETRGWADAASLALAALVGLPAADRPAADDTAAVTPATASKGLPHPQKPAETKAEHAPETKPEQAPETTPASGE